MVYAPLNILGVRTLDYSYVARFVLQGRKSQLI